MTGDNAIVERYSGNPILTKEDFPSDFKIKTVFNSGIIKAEGKYVMICRVENAALHNMMWAADSEDGYNFTPRPAPIPMPEDNPEFADMAPMYYDPRITRIEDVFYIVHAAHSNHGCRLSLMKSVNLRKFEWLGFISETDNRNGVLFPEKFNGLYARLDRPNTGSEFGDIWISYSPDLLHWGQSKCILRNKDVYWAWTKIGAGAVPIRTNEGWLNIFHGVRTQCKAHYVYQLGVALHDIDDPSKIISVGEDAILMPEEPYELIGQTPSVVFTAGAVLEDNGEVKIYYGGADTVQCVGISTLDGLINTALNRR